MRAGEAAASCRSRGFTLLIMLGLLAVLALAVGTAGASWRDQAQREREAEWLRIGEIYARAIESYQSKSPGSLKQWPSRLDELLEDPRFVGVQRHMRQTYPDPLQPMQGWSLIKDDQDRILGVYSTARDEPFLTKPPVGSHLKLQSQGQGYGRWAFVAGPASSSSSN